MISTQKRGGSTLLKYIYHSMWADVSSSASFQVQKKFVKGSFLLVLRCQYSSERKGRRVYPYKKVPSGDPSKIDLG